MPDIPDYKKFAEHRIQIFGIKQIIPKPLSTRAAAITSRKLLNELLNSIIPPLQIVQNVVK